MKKFCIMIVVLYLAITPIIGLSEDIDLTGLSFDDLVKLQERITMAMWLTDDWQEVTVPAGLYQVGVEIPAGKWTITATPQAYMAYVRIGLELDDTGNAISWNGRESESLYGVDSWAYNESKMNSWTVTLKDGMFISMDSAMVFTPYAGPSFSFR